jgi:2-alkenal reductase
LDVTRPGAVAALAVASAVLGGTLALVLGKAVGWVDDDGSRVQTVLVPTPDDATPAAEDVEGEAAKPLLGNGFDAAELYRKRAAGVVTIFALFGEGGVDDPDVTASQGSGFVVSDDGYILTNSHVVTTAGESGAREAPDAADTVYVQFRDGERVPAKIVGWDVFDDVGLLKVDPADHAVSPVPLGDSSTVVVGEPVAAIGSPFGQESSLSVGVVSATERSIDSLTSRFNLVDAIQTDAPINRGNSGGPMFDASGEVIGINAQIRSESGTAEGVGFAIPINAARRSMEQLIQTGEVRYAWLGVTTQTVTPRLAERFGFAETRGAAVQSVAGGSPADEAGLVGGGAEEEFDGVPFCPGGDLIVAVDGEPVRSAEDVVRAVNQERLPGDEIRLTILRGSERLELTVVLADRPANPPALAC